jgi:hypothetical protein
VRISIQFVLDTRDVAYICWWVVAEVVQHDCERIYYDTQDVAPAPLQLGVQIQCSCNGRSKYRERDGRREDEGVHRSSETVRYKFSQTDVEGQLSSCSETVDRVCSLDGQQDDTLNK